MILALAAFAAEPPPAAMVCAGCHGPTGNSAAPTWPSLAGQPAAYLEKQLWDFRTQRRTDPVMSGMAAPLEPVAITEVAAWFAAQAPAPAPRKAPDPRLVAQGAALFSAGDPARGLAPCRSCHGARAEGGQDGRGHTFPALAGQHGAYVQKQLRALASGERANDPGGMMSLVARRLTPADIDAVAAWLDQAPAGGVR